MKAETLEEFRARVDAESNRRPYIVVTHEVARSVAALLPLLAARRSRISRMHREYRRKRR